MRFHISSPVISASAGVRLFEVTRAPLPSANHSPDGIERVLAALDALREDMGESGDGEAESTCH